MRIMKSSFSAAVVVVFAITQFWSCVVPQRQPAVVDLAFVIKMHGEKADSRVDALGQEFLDQLQDHLSIGPTQTRVAIVYETDDGAVHVICTLQEVNPHVCIKDAKYKLGDHGVEQTTGEQGKSDPDLAAEVAAQVFVAGKGDRQAAPNVMVLIAIKPRDTGNDDSSRYAQSFPSMIVRLIAQDYVDNTKTVFISSAKSQMLSEKYWSTAASAVVGQLNEYWYWCDVISNDTQCFYDAKKRCIFERSYTLKRDSDPKGYCANGMTIYDCGNAKECQTLCDRSVVWSPCGDCKNKTQTTIRDPAMSKKFYDNCPQIVKQTRPCKNPLCPNEEKKKGPFPIWAIVLIAVGSSVLVIIVAGVIICFLARRKEKTDRGTQLTRRAGEGTAYERRAWSSYMPWSRTYGGRSRTASTTTGMRGGTRGPPTQSATPGRTFR